MSFHLSTLHMEDIQSSLNQLLTHRIQEHNLYKCSKASPSHEHSYFWLRICRSCPRNLPRKFGKHHHLRRHRPTANCKPPKKYSSHLRTRTPRTTHQKRTRKTPFFHHRRSSSNPAIRCDFHHSRNSF